MNKIADLLHQHRFMRGLDNNLIEQLAGCARNVVFQPGDYVYRHGESADFFYLIRHGSVALELFASGRDPLTFLTLKSGELLGASWLVPPYRWVYDARAVELTRAIEFKCECLRDKCEADHHVGYEMMKRFIPPLVERLHAAQFQIADVYGNAATR